MNKLLTIGLFIAGTTIACGEKEKISWDTQEAARQQAIDNAEFNANAFRNAQFPQYSIRMRGDSSIGPDCKTGDGWASVDLLPGDNTKPIVNLKCSTVSATIGCMTKEDFQTRPQYSNQDNSCNPDIPFPLPKIKK